MVSNRALQSVFADRTVLALAALQFLAVLAIGRLAYPPTPPAPVSYLALPVLLPAVSGIPILWEVTDPVLGMIPGPVAVALGAAALLSMYYVQAAVAVGVGRAVRRLVARPA